MWKGLRGSEEGVDDVEEGVGGTDVVVVVSMASARAVVNVEKREVAIYYFFLFVRGKQGAGLVSCKHT